MHIDKYDKKRLLPLLVILDRIKQNTTKSWIWFPFINRHGVYLDIGGTSKACGFYIGEIIDGKPALHTNGYIKSVGRVDFNNMVHPNDGIQVDTYRKWKALIKRDWINKPLTYEYVQEVIVETRKICKL